MTKEEKIQKLKKFTQDPDWNLMEELVNNYLAPLTEIGTIDITKSNDEIATEVRGRQIAIDGLTKFLNEAKIINGNISNTKPNFN